MSTLYELTEEMMMLSEMMKGQGNMSDGSSNGFSAMLPFMMMSGNNGFDNMFEGLFDFDNNVDDEKED